MRSAIALAMLLAVVAPIARAEESCVPSASGAFAFAVHVSPRAGGACRMIATVYEGTCEPLRERWHAELGCSETRRMVVTDNGRLVSILAPRATNPLWPIVRIFESASDSVLRRSLRLSDIPGTEELRAPVRMTFEGATLVMTTRRARATVAISDIEELGR